MVKREKCRGETRRSSRGVAQGIEVGTGHCIAPPLPPNRTCRSPASGSPNEIGTDKLLKLRRSKPFMATQENEIGRRSDSVTRLRLRAAQGRSAVFQSEKPQQKNLAKAVWKATFKGHEFDRQNQQRRPPKGCFVAFFFPADCSLSLPGTAQRRRGTFHFFRTPFSTHPPFSPPPIRLVRAQRSEAPPPALLGRSWQTAAPTTAFISKANS